MIVVITGPDHAIAREAVRKHATQADPDGQSTSEMDGTSVSMTDVIQAIASVGFFSAGRVVIVNSLIAQANRTVGRGRIAPDWSALVDAVPDASTLILAEPTLASVPAGVRKALPPDAVVVQGDPPRGPQLIAWIRDTASAVGGSIAEADAHYLAERLFPQAWARKNNNPAFDRPPDLGLLRSELEKLAVAAHPNPILRQHVDLLVHRGDQDRIFGFIDAAVAGDIARATTELDRLIAAGEEPHRILAQLGQTIELSAVLAVAERRDPAAVGKEIGLSNPARMNAIARGLRSTSPRSAQRATGALAEADRKMKTGILRDPVDVLHYLIGDLARGR